MLFHNVPKVSIVRSSQFAMLNTPEAREGACQAVKICPEMVSWVQLAATTGETSPRTMNVTGKERAIDLIKPSRERMYLTHQAKGHVIPVALWQQGHPIPWGRSSPSNGLESPARCKEAERRGHRG